MIRYGVIGTGMMGWEHLRTLAIIPDAVVTAVADPDPGSRAVGRSTAGEHVEVYEDYRDLLRRAPVDAVVIATPNHTHAAVLQDAIASRGQPSGRAYPKRLSTTLRSGRPSR